MLQSFDHTWIFRVLLLALLATAAYAAFRHEQRRHARQRHALEEEVRTRLLELRAANARLEQASQTDPLTGLRNHRYLANQLPADLAWYERERPRADRAEWALGFVLVEVDGATALGETERTQALHHAAQVLGSLVRSCDYVARWGEGFLLVLRPLPERRLDGLRQRIRDAFAQPWHRDDAAATGRLSCSTGLAEYPLREARRLGISWEDTVELAGAALRWVQARGGDGWAVLRPTMLAEVPQITGDLSREAVESLLRVGRLHLDASPAGRRSAGSTA
jgi:GGDEF domain-containing protein